MKNILIVDDSEVNLYLIKSIFLEDSDVDVTIENNSRKALPLIREGKPDAIVLDLMMPHIDGFRILEMIKSEQEIANIPIMVITARQDADAEYKVSQYGVDAYIKKPINLRCIENKLRQMLSYETKNTG